MIENQSEDDLVILIEDDESPSLPSVQAQTHQKNLNSTSRKNLEVENKSDEIWIPLDEIASKPGYSKEYIREIIADPRYSDFLSQRSRFAKSPAKDGKM